MDGLDLLGIASLIGLYGIWRRAVWNLSRLPERVYRAPSMLAAALRTWMGLGLLMLAMIMALPGVVQTSWQSFGALALPLKIFALGAAGVMTWQFSTYARNFYVDRLHLADRLVLVALFGLIALHPLAIPAFVVCAIVIIRQFDHPRCLHYNWTETLLPFDALGMLGAAIPCVATGVVDPASAAIAVVGVQAAEYVIAGLAKLRLPVGPTWWILRNPLGNLLMTAAANGFLARVPEERLAGPARLINRYSVLAAIGTLMIEVGAIFMLLDFRLAILLTAGYLLLHTCILLSSGVFFWKWMVTDVAILAMLSLIVSTGHAGAVFGLWPFLVTVGIVILSPWICRPSWLGWTDTGFTNFFRFEVVTPMGDRLEIPRHAFAPLDVSFCQSRFFFMAPRPTLVGTFGCNTRMDASSAALSRALIDAKGDTAAIEQIRRTLGRRVHRAGAAEQLTRLLRKRVESFAPRGPWRRLTPPKHILVSPRMEPYTGQQPIDRIDIRYVEACFDGQRNRVITDEVVRSIPWEDAPERLVA